MNDCRTRRTPVVCPKVQRAVAVRNVELKILVGVGVAKVEVVRARGVDEVGAPPLDPILKELPLNSAPAAPISRGHTRAGSAIKSCSAGAAAAIMAPFIAWP